MNWIMEWTAEPMGREDLQIHTITNTEELIQITNNQIEDVLYISEKICIPETKNIKHIYRSDFELKSKKEANELVKQKKAMFYHKDKNNDFFVYNERAGELIAFKKNDYLIFPQWYLTYDGVNYISYDDLGKEIGRF